MSMKHPGRHHAKAAAKRREKQSQLKQERRDRRQQLTEARAKQK